MDRTVRGPSPPPAPGRRTTCRASNPQPRAFRAGTYPSATRSPAVVRGTRCRGVRPRRARRRYRLDRAGSARSARTRTAHPRPPGRPLEAGSPRSSNNRSRAPCCAHERVELAQGLPIGVSSRGSQWLVEIDAIGTETSQTRLERRGRRRVMPRRDRASWLAELRCEDDSVATALQRPTEERFTLRVAVDVGRVEQRDPCVDRRIDDLAGPGLVDAPAEVVAPEPNDRDLERPDRACPHDAEVTPTASNARRGLASRVASRKTGVEPIPESASMKRHR